MVAIQARFDCSDLENPIWVKDPMMHEPQFYPNLETGISWNKGIVLKKDSDCCNSRKILV